ncbi:MAG: hypothetical protein WCA84_08525 [Ignavibacteriaceae bacterium]
MLLNIRQLTITSIIFGFFLLPVHELGHVIGDWVTGHPAGMSYARDYLFTNGDKPFLGILGGPLLPLIISAVAVAFIYNQKLISVFYPVAVIGILDRMVLYISGVIPSDEGSLAAMMGWNIHSFKYMFLSVEIILLLLVIYSLYKYKINFIHALLVFFIPVVSFVVGASVGVFIVERYVFPAQFKIQFG